MWCVQTETSARLLSTHSLSLSSLFHAQLVHHEKDRISSTDDIPLDPSTDINELSVVAEGEERTTWFVWALVACSTISGLLFGMGVTSLSVCQTSKNSFASLFCFF